MRFLTNNSGLVRTLVTITILAIFHTTHYIATNRSTRHLRNHIDKTDFASRQLTAYAIDQLNELKVKVELINLETQGERHLDAMHDAYMKSVLKIQSDRLQRFDSKAFQRPRRHCQLLVVIPTASRARLGPQGYRYLNETLHSLLSQDAEGAWNLICILVVNMSPGDHEVFDILRRNFTRQSRCSSCSPGPKVDGGTSLVEGQCEAWCSPDGYCGLGSEYRVAGAVDCRSFESYNRTRTTLRFIEQSNFNDPFPLDYDKKKGQITESSSAQRQQGMHLSHALLEASRWRADYIMIVEDDMPLCNRSSLSHVRHAIDLANSISRNTSSYWSMVRVGFGGNGVIIHWEDAPLLGSFLLKHLSRRPIDWLMPEWAASHTYESALINTNRRIYTYRLNLFFHIGALSNFNRGWNISQVNNGENIDEEEFELPGCFQLNNFLRPEERFNESFCKNSLISPCYCHQSKTFCDQEDLDLTRLSKTAKEKLLH